MNDLASVPKANIEYNAFNQTHRHMTTFNMGFLVPVLCLETLPGDKYDIDIRSFLRFSPLVSPVMHRYEITIDSFFVPNRILWDNWEEWIVGKLEVEPPKIRFTSPFPAGAPGIGSLGDYIGLPTDINTTGVEVSAFQLGAYWKIFDEYYRDQNLTVFPGEFTGLGDGTDNAYVDNLSRTLPFRRAWSHDYFTSALPWAQRGVPVQLPLLADDAGAIAVTRPDSASQNVYALRVATNSPGVTGNVKIDEDGKLIDDGNNFLNLNPNNTLEVLLGDQAATIRDLRTAFALQSYLERSATGGQRYREWLYSQFGVVNDDASLQRPEFLGRQKGVVTVSEVLSSVQTETDPLGRMGGHGIALTEDKNITCYCKEHGFIITIINVQPEAIYYQGIPRQFTRETPLDYYLEPFARIGEQEIKNKELFVNGQDLATLDDTFGYQLRYAEYKTANHRLTGQFKDTLRYWVAPRTFDDLPGLNEEFITANPSQEIFAVIDPDEHKIFCQLLFNIKALKKMPIHGTPMIM